jgi:hypothetical protein
VLLACAGLADMIAALRREAADRAKRDDAARVVEHSNNAIIASAVVPVR